MNNYPDLQLKAAKFLDEYLNPHVTSIDLKSRKIFKNLSSLINICKIPMGKFHLHLTLLNTKCVFFF